MYPKIFKNSTMRPSPPTHPSNQPSPHSQPPPPHSQMMSSQPFMGPRYPAGPRPGVRMPPQIGNDFNGVCFKIILLNLSLMENLIVFCILQYHFNTTFSYELAKTKMKFCQILSLFPQNFQMRMIYRIEILPILFVVKSLYIHPPASSRHRRIMSWVLLKIK